MNWSDPNFVALFAAWGQWISGVGALLAVVAAIWIALQSNRGSQKQARQTRYDAARPVLVMDSNDPIYESDNNIYTNSDNRTYRRSLLIYTQPQNKGWISWDASEHVTTLKNVGTGAAFNVMSVIFGPETLEDNGKILDASASKNDYWQHKINILNIGESKECRYRKVPQYLLKGNLNGYSLLAPPQPIIDPSDKKRLLYEDWVVCRITTTYRDIFQRKHVSIFDLDIRGYWIMRTFLEDIPKDLYDLQKGDRPSRIHFLTGHLNLFSKKRMP